MSETFIFDKLSMLQHIYSNCLSESKEIIQPTSIKTKLHQHQYNMVHGMHLHREKLTRGFLCENQAINGKIGIVADEPGTGKTLSVLTYLAKYSKTFPKMTCELTPNSSTYFFSHDIQTISDTYSANLIIVPHYLYHQWIQEIQQHTSMKCCGLETRRMVKGAELSTTMKESDFVITTNKCYKFVQDYATDHGIQWNNIFIDEASSIYIKSSDPPLQFQFLWFITNNWIPLIFKNPSLSKIDLYHLRDRLQLHPDLEDWLLDREIPHYESSLVSSAYLKDYLPFMHKRKYFMVLRNSKLSLQQSILLPDMIQEYYQCRPNVTLQSLASYFLVRNMTPQFNLQKIPYILQVLHIDCKSVADYCRTQPNSVQHLIRRKASDNECVICLEQAEYPIMMSCCNNICCGRCLLTNMLLTKKCPTCRELLGTNTVCCLKELTNEERLEARSKPDICLDILRTQRHGKFIIYSSYDNIYYQLFEEIDKLGLKAERIENNLFSMLRSLKNYQEGRTNILFISNIDLIRGLSLKTTSHLIFYHELPSYEWKQVLIRSAQRMGRHQPLRLIHLNSEIQV
jgi:hypothetical protein